MVGDLETFLRGMETLAGEGYVGLKARLETFLRGMETSCCRAFIRSMASP